MELNQIPGAFQSRVRLSVIAALLTGPQNFRALQDLTGATPGNLGKQLELLEEDGYVLQFTIEKGVITRETARNAIPRITVESGMTGRDLVRVIELAAEKTFAAEREGK